MSFHDLRLSEPIVRAVDEEGYTTPTPIQAIAIPEAIAGRDILGCAQTGTGKTCAFALPILQRLGGEGGGRKRGRAGRKGTRGGNPRALILCPTRELATQILDSFIAYGRYVQLRYSAIYGGVSQGRQVNALRAGIDVLVATPGRLLDLMNQGYIDLRMIEVLVLDEADRMLDMGFIGDIRKVVAKVPRERQTLFFSATISPTIRRLADSMLQNPISLETAPTLTPVESVTQRVYMIERMKKAYLLKHLLQDQQVGRALVFTRTKYGADKLSRLLKRFDIKVEAIHGNKTQNARFRALENFRSGRTHVLVATDIASRGIDVDEITHVFNFDMPIDTETYVHRIGRTARAGASGIAVSFCDRNERKILQSIERQTEVQFEVVRKIPAFITEEADVAQREQKERRNQQKPAGKERHGSRNSDHGARKKKNASPQSWEDRGSTGGKKRKKKKKNASPQSWEDRGSTGGRKKSKGKGKSKKKKHRGAVSSGPRKPAKERAGERGKKKKAHKQYGAVGKRKSPTGGGSRKSSRRSRKAGRS